MAEKANDSFVVNAGGGWTYLARIKLHNGQNATQEDITSITRTIRNCATKAEVTAEVEVEDVIFDTLQTNALLWDQQFNMQDPVPAAAVTARVRHTLQYTFLPAEGEPIKTKEIDIEGD